MVYGYEYEALVPEFGGGLLMGAAGFLVAIVIVLMLVALAISVASYVLGAIGL